jgi:hypothetical protein
MRVKPGERGSVLILVPAGFLVLMLLGAIALDSAVAYQARNQLHDALAAAANDAVAAGVSNRSFYTGGTVRLDGPTATSVACRSVEAQNLGSLHDLQLRVAASGRSIHLQGSATVDAVFGRFLPGFGYRRVSASADAVLSSGEPVATPEWGAARLVHCF